MVSAPKTKAQRMHEYVVSRLTNSRISIANQVCPDQYRVCNGGNMIDLYLHTDSDSRDLERRFANSAKQGYGVANIFYKETDHDFCPIFFRVLEHDDVAGFLSQFAGRYGYADARKMIGFRSAESLVLNLQRDSHLVYYAPDNTQNNGNTEEGLVKYKFSNPRRILPGSSSQYGRYGLPNEKLKLSRKLRFSPLSKDSAYFVLSDATAGRKIERQISQRILEEQVKSFLEETGKTLDDFGGKIEDVLPYINP
jgi:hypothetical protein